MEKEKSKAGRRKIVYKYDSRLDPWVVATRDFFETMMPPTLSRRAASTILIAAGMSNEKVVELTGMCIRSVRALRKLMEEQEPTPEIFTIKPGSGRKLKIAGVEEEVWRELDTGKYITGPQVAGMLKEKFGIEGSVQLAMRVLHKWRKMRGME